MLIANLFENYITEDSPRIVVIYPGRFQPFHLGHKDVFASLQAKFGRDNVFIATSNKTELPKSPFNFTDKIVFMTSAGVPADRIIEVANPYKLPEQFDPGKTIYIVAVGSPDKDRLKPDTTKKDGSPTYFKSLINIEDAVTADKHGYVIIADERQKTIKINNNNVDVSHGTQTRAAWNEVRNDPVARADFLKQMYGHADPEVGRILDKIPQTVNEEAAGVGVVKNSKDPRYVMATLGDDNDVTAATLPKMMAGYHLTKKFKKLKEDLDLIKEKWSQKYKRSINCNNPRGFSQRAHCQGRKKHGGV